MALRAKKATKLEKAEKAISLGLEFGKTLEIFSQNAATAVLTIEDIISNHFDKIDIIKAIEGMKDGMTMTATEFIELYLPEEYEKIHKSKLKSKRFNRIREGFYLYHLINIPIMFSYKIHKRYTDIKSWEVENLWGLSMSKKEITYIYSYCNAHAREQKLVWDEEAFLTRSAHLFNQTLLRVSALSRFYVTQEKCYEGIYDIINDSRWLLEEGFYLYDPIVKTSQPLYGYPLYDKNDSKRGNFALATKLILKEYYKTLFWDSLRDQFGCNNFMFAKWT